MSAALGTACLVSALPAHAASSPVAVPVAEAAGPVTVSDSCGVTQADLDAIQAIRSNPNLSYEAELQQELAVRKNLLNEILTCAENQVVSLQAELATSSVSNAQASAIQSQLGDSLNSASAYYELERGKLTGAGIYGTEQVAQEVLSWRASVFAPLSDRVSNFALWAQNQPLFTAAAARMTQVGQVVSFLSSANSQDLAAAFATAQTSFVNAQNENAAALSALGQSQATAQVNLLIQQSLSSLAQTYQNLFAVSNIIQTLVPQSQ